MKRSALLSQCTEGLLLALAFLAPWAFGAVDAWAELVVALIVLNLTALVSVQYLGAGRLRSLTCWPSLALLGLVLLCCVQVTPASDAVRRAVAPADFAWRASLEPAGPERLPGGETLKSPFSEPVLSINPTATRGALARLAAAWLLLQAVLGLDDPRGALRRFGQMTVVNGCLLGCFSILQWGTWNGRIYWVRPAAKPEVAWYAGGPFMCHNHLSAYLNMALGFAFGFLLAARLGGPVARRRGGGWLWCAYVVGLLVVCQFASHSRGGLLAGALVSLGLLLGQGKRGLVLVGMVLLMALLCLLLLLATSQGTTVERLTNVAAATTDVRWQVWGIAVDLWARRPLLGAGLGTFETAALPFTHESASMYFSRAENEYLDVLAEGGAVGLGLVLLGLASAGLLARSAVRGQAAGRDRMLVLGAACGGLAVVLHWVTDFSFHIPGVAISVLILFGLLCRLGLEARPAGEPGRLAIWLSGGANLALPVLALLVVLSGASWSRVEASLASSGVPLPGTTLPVLESGASSRVEAPPASSGPPLPGTAPPLVESEEAPRHELELAAAGLGRALAERPDWSEGHFRLGVVHLKLYRVAALALLDKEIGAERTPPPSAPDGPAPAKTETTTETSETPTVARDWATKYWPKGRASNTRLAAALGGAIEAVAPAAVPLPEGSTTGPSGPSGEAEAVPAEGPQEPPRSIVSDPLYLRGRALGPSKVRAVPLERLLEHEPVRDHLVPAARCFLEARRCSPLSAVAQAGVSLTQFVLEEAEPADASNHRAFRLTGSDWQTASLVALMAVQTGDLDLAARGWRRCLEANPSVWEQVATAAGRSLTAERILAEVVPPESASLTLLFADRLYSPWYLAPSRNILLEAALERAAGEPGVDEAGRLVNEANALERLGRYPEARERLSQALALVPAEGDWREHLAYLLARSGDFERALRHLRTGLQFDPKQWRLVSLHAALVDASARGEKYWRSRSSPYPRVVHKDFQW